MPAGSRSAKDDSCALTPADSGRGGTFRLSSDRDGPIQFSSDCFLEGASGSTVCPEDCFKTISGFARSSPCLGVSIRGGFVVANTVCRCSVVVGSVRLLLSAEGSFSLSEGQSLCSFAFTAGTTLLLRFPRFFDGPIVLEGEGHGATLLLDAPHPINKHNKIFLILYIIKEVTVWSVVYALVYPQP